MNSTVSKLVDASVARLLPDVANPKEVRRELAKDFVRVLRNTTRLQPVAQIMKLPPDALELLSKGLKPEIRARWPLVGWLIDILVVAVVVLVLRRNFGLMPFIPLQADASNYGSAEAKVGTQEPS